MLGTFRLFLAYGVLWAHLAGQQSTSHLGVFAVFGFYVLSGFLITRVLQERYAFRFGAFWSNRFLRLFPIYYLIVAVTLLLIVLIPDQMAAFKSDAWRADADAKDWFAVLTIFPMGTLPVFEWSFRPAPPIWSVGAELINYALLWIVIARSWKFACAALVLSLLYHAWSLAEGQPWSWRYYPFWAAILPFSIGTLIHFGQRHAARWKLSKSPNLLGFVALLWIANVIVTGYHGGLRNEPTFFTSFYINLALISALIVLVAQSNIKLPARFDKALGDLSYPVFLCHWLAGFLVATAFFSAKRQGVDLAIGGIIAATFMAQGFVLMQERFIEPQRDKIRKALPSTLPKVIIS